MILYIYIYTLYNNLFLKYICYIVYIYILYDLLCIYILNSMLFYIVHYKSYIISHVSVYMYIYIYIFQLFLCIFISLSLCIYIYICLHVNKCGYMQLYTSPYLILWSCVTISDCMKFYVTVTICGSMWLSETICEYTVYVIIFYYYMWLYVILWN